jgi:hypothetical protein
MRARRRRDGCALPFEQAPVHRFLGQRVAKNVDCAFGLDAFVNKLEAAQLAQL